MRIDWVVPVISSLADHFVVQIRRSLTVASCCLDWTACRTGSSRPRLNNLPLSSPCSASVCNNISFFCCGTLTNNQIKWLIPAAMGHRNTEWRQSRQHQRPETDHITQTKSNKESARTTWTVVCCTVSMFNFSLCIWIHHAAQLLFHSFILCVQFWQWTLCIHIFVVCWCVITLACGVHCVNLAMATINLLTYIKLNSTQSLAIKYHPDCLSSAYQGVNGVFGVSWTLPGRSV